MKTTRCRLQCWFDQATGAFVLQQLAKPRFVLTVRDLDSRPQETLTWIDDPSHSPLPSSINDEVRKAISRFLAAWEESVLVGNN